MALSLFGKLTRLTRRATEAGTGARHHVAGTLGFKQGVGLPISIDFGVGSLKVLQVAGGDAPTLVAAACLETPENLLLNHDKRLEFQLQALPKIIRQGGFKGRRAVCSIPAWQTMCKNLQFQRTDGVPLDALVNGAIATQMNANPDAFVHRHIEVCAGSAGSASGGKTEVILIAASRELVDRLMQGIIGARLDPVGMHSEFAASLRAFEYLNRRTEDAEKATLYLDIGAHTTKVLIAHGPSLVFGRIVELGGRHLDETIANQLKCEPCEARVKRLATDQRGASVSPGTGASAPMPHGVPIPERRADGPRPGLSADVSTQELIAVGPPDTDLSEPLEILTDEVQMCVRYHAAQFPGRRVERAVFVGGEARHRGLCQHIAGALRIPAQMADPLARVARTGTEPSLGVDLRKPQPGWAVALGLCLSPTDL